MGNRLDCINDWEERAREAQYRVANLARNLKLTSRQLERYFLRTFNCHPKDWIKDLRRTDYWRLKRQGLLDKEIATLLCFKQASSFSRAFGQRRNARLKSLKARRLDK